MIGQTVGPYEITGLLGKGGMGEVYRAQDKNLDREVALKILPADLANDPDRLARFKREAKVLASLQHQNIAAIFGLEELGDRPILVMELAAGQDLSLRIEEKSLTANEIEKTARQLARGLEFAHEHGIVHRDLKPANVKVFEDGRVKILDFGLARALGPASPSSSDDSASFQPTLTQGLTVAGAVLGTAAYMSPEQARGYEVDRRSDIWSFGVILFEMLTGQRLFEGETASDTMAAILRQEPDWESLPADANPLLIQICRRCLEKDPNQRMRDIGEVRVALEGSTNTVMGLSGMSGLSHIPAPPTRGSAVLPWVAVAILAVALGVVGYLGYAGKITPEGPPPAMLHASVTMPKGVEMNLNPAAPGPVTVSMDSKRLAFSGVDTNGTVMLYIRDLDKPEAFPIPGTTSAHYPFWSPDNRTVAFFNDKGKLAKVDVAGGPVVTICSVENAKGGSWNEDDQILFATSHISSIFMVSANGGDPIELTQLEQDEGFRSHRFPCWLPGGDAFLYVAVNRSANNNDQDAELRYHALSDSTSKTLLPCRTSAIYNSGEILFVHEEVLMARPFNVDLAEFAGPARPILGSILTLPAAHLSVMSASEQGVLAYSSGGGGFGNSQLFQIDPDGSNETSLYTPLMTYGFDVNPDGSALTLSLPDKQSGTFDVWVLEMARDLPTRLTFDPETELSPIWSPGGQWVTYASDTNNRANLYRKKANGTGAPELLFASEKDCTPIEWSQDGKLLSFTASEPQSEYSQGIYNHETGEVNLIHQGQGYLTGRGTFSPGGNWLAFMSMETGSVEIFVESLTSPGNRWRVSANGGLFPQWSPTGDTIYYLQADGDLLAVPVTSTAEGGLQFGTPNTVVQGVHYAPSGTYSVNPKTGQLIFLRSIQANQSSILGLVTQWQSLLPNDVEMK